MSRLHEALKRAERERRFAEQQLLQQRGTGAFENHPDPQGSTPRRDEPPAQDTVAAVIENVANSFSLVQWQPDPRRLLVTNTRNNPGLEEFRLLRSQLYQLRSKKPLKILLVASPFPGEGKTFVSSNLAATLARQGNTRVLLVDGDLRWPRIHSVIGTSPEPGLAEYLQGQADESAAIQVGPIKNLFFLPGGKQVSNSAELIADERFRNLINHVAPLFEWVVIDSPPALAISDAAVMAQSCDGVVIVMASGSTPCDAAQKLVRLFGNKTLGAVINRVPVELTYSSRYYAYYGEQNGKGVSVDITRSSA